MILIQII